MDCQKKISEFPYHSTVSIRHFELLTLYKTTHHLYVKLCFKEESSFSDRQNSETTQQINNLNRLKFSTIGKIEQIQKLHNKLTASIA